MNRAILSESLGARGADVIGNQNARDIGIQASGILKTKNDKPYLNYAAGVFNGSGINKFDNNKDKAFAGRVIVSPIQKMWIGGSYYNGSSRWGDSLNVDKNRDRWALEAEYQYKVFTLRAEYMQGVDDTINKGGYYVQLIGDVIPKKFNYQDVSNILTPTKQLPIMPFMFIQFVRVFYLENYVKFKSVTILFAKKQPCKKQTMLCRCNFKLHFN
ncbi:MAG: hypothetical protein IPL12_03710 [Bacteroidetes bacterium]|nr:hypothetical protein [Bacteroidota bacterium]